MWFGTLILKNLIRRPARSILTVLAIAIAIGSVVSLVGIASGFETTFQALYDRKGIDLIVVRTGARQRMASALPERLGDEMRQLRGVKDVICGLVDMVSLSEYGVHSAFVQGWLPETSAFDHLKVLQGRMLTKQDTTQVMVGNILAHNLGMGVGDSFDLIEGEKVTIVGVYETPAVFENGALVMSLHELQRVMDRKGQVTGFSVILDKDMKKSDPTLVPSLKTQIEGLEKKVSAMPTADHVGSLTEIQIVKAMALLTSAIALVIGLFGVMNTMVMAVNERTKEIGILRAVGWRPGRVLRLVLLEAVVLSLVGAVVGMLGSVALLQLLTRLPGVNGLIDGHIHPLFFVYGFVIATVVGLIGGILPARRAAKMLPTVALRQE